MRTVKEVSELTGITVRTLHYYDEIGLFSPTKKNESGYRFYDDKAMENLQQILFFREFDIPLKEIKSFMENPELDRNQILLIQRRMLAAKKGRMERLIASIDDILKGENKMDFAVFNKTEIEEMFRAMYEHMPEKIRNTAVNEFGSIEEWEKHYVDTVSSEKMQKQYAKVIEWYGGKEAYLDTVRHPIAKEAVQAYKKRINAMQQRLAEKQGCDINSFDVKEIIGEYGFVMKQMLQIKEEREIMLAQAKHYRCEAGSTVIDKEYGAGTAVFFAEAIEAFYKK